MQKDIFQFLKNLFEKTFPVTPTENQTNDYYMVLRYLSLYPKSFLVAASANKVANKIPPWALGCYLYHRVEVRRPAPFIPYPKKEKTEAYRGELLQKVGNAFCCNPLHAAQTAELLERHCNVYSLFGLEEKGSGNRQVLRNPKRSRKKV